MPGVLQTPGLSGFKGRPRRTLLAVKARERGPCSLRNSPLLLDRSGALLALHAAPSLLRPRAPIANGSKFESQDQSHRAKLSNPAPVASKYLVIAC